MEETKTSKSEKRKNASDKGDSIVNTKKRKIEAMKPKLKVVKDKSEKVLDVQNRNSSKGNGEKNILQKETVVPSKEIKKSSSTKNIENVNNSKVIKTKLKKQKVNSIFKKGNKKPNSMKKKQ